jgi:nitroimidazol reductase NimA-like FMN-containing flavoprotein (pyridoxamine 5'-phosphate oxidase superfamily)
VTTNGDGELDAQQCRAVLAACRYGRLVFTERALPVVVPVSFLLDGEAVLVAARARACGM